MTSHYQIWKKHGKIWKYIGKHGILPVPVHRNWGIFRSLLLILLIAFVNALILQDKCVHNVHMSLSCNVSTSFECIYWEYQFLYLLGKDPITTATDESTMLNSTLRLSGLSASSGWSSCSKDAMYAWSCCGHGGQFQEAPSVSEWRSNYQKHAEACLAQR